ncbi:AAA family ATPase [Geminicoccus roseus]|uniref:AAA family ATPase n=1 Tax=Geminicoccus roseus TaxID=404900 RepID=UPI0003FF048D|nr:AAA family ATPase [Geminicoccus roseus]
MDGLPRIIVVTGAMAAGKSTIAQALAERLPQSVHLQGDLFRRMIVTGAVEMTAPPSAEALAQLELRYRLASDAAAGYAAAGYLVVYQDVILGPYLGQVVERLRPWRPGVVVLDPDPVVLARRDRQRQASAYGSWQPEQMAEILRRQTPRVGRWIDSSAQTVEQTLAAILADPAELRVGATEPPRG